ncbi:Hypothetical predicted protein [Paramuricea clavata]|uniref:Uncharacterized protein n=1 Tax=Paramuricea clavata TaxID=317549 RepID=A0A6S7H3X6_PARCT|nr:Hypothetical predicted protein [Paramuricea clavata]
MSILKNGYKRPGKEGQSIEQPTVNLYFREKEAALLEEIYTGRYLPPAARGVTQSDDYLRNLTPGAFVAVNTANYKTFPVIGKVSEVREDETELEYWQGSYTKSWQPHLLTRNKEKIPWSDTLPKRSIIVCNFFFDESGKLQENTRRSIP